MTSLIEETISGAEGGRERRKVAVRVRGADYEFAEELPSWLAARRAPDTPDQSSGYFAAHVVRPPT